MFGLPPSPVKAHGLPFSDTCIEQRGLVAGVSSDQKQEVSLFNASDSSVEEIVGTQVRSEGQMENSTSVDQALSCLQFYSLFVPTRPQPLEKPLPCTGCHCWNDSANLSGKWEPLHPPGLQQQQRYHFLQLLETRKECKGMSRARI